METNYHPLVQLVLSYYEEFAETKENNADISNLDYNRCFGLSVNAPENWPWLDAIYNCSNFAVNQGETKIQVIFTSTDIYREVADKLEALEEHISYMQWHEIYVAMKRVDEDTRFLQRIRRKIASSDLIFIVGATGTAQEVIDQVRGYSEGCLVVLG